MLDNVFLNDLLNYDDIPKLKVDFSKNLEGTFKYEEA